MSQPVQRLNVDQLVKFLESKRLGFTADFFKSSTEEIEDGWINEDFVKRHFYFDGYEDQFEGFYRELKSQVTTYVPIELFR